MGNSSVWRVEIQSGSSLSKCGKGEHTDPRSLTPLAYTHPFLPLLHNQSIVRSKMVSDGKIYILNIVHFETRCVTDTF